MKTSIITSQEVESLITMDMVIAAVEEAYKIYSERKVQLLPALAIDVKKHNGEVSLKSGYDQVDEFIGVKLATGYYSNPENYGLPTGLATILLADAKSGAPLAVMDGSIITNMRTGAAGAVSSKYLARKDAKKIAILGTGIQARMQVLATSRLFDLDEVLIWGRNEEKVTAYIEEMSGQLDLAFTACATPAEAVQAADIVITTTTSEAPLFTKEDVKPGTHIACIGADMPGKQEIDAQLFAGNKVVIDSLDQCKKSGEIEKPLKEGIIRLEEIHGEIGQVILGEKAGRENDKEITIFDSTGLSVQDITTAKAVYQRAKEEDKGLNINLI